MLKERRNAADCVRSSFLAAEAIQDQAAIQTTKCLLDALEARASANLALGTGIQAIELLKESAVMAIDARALLVKAHGELAKIPGQIGLNVVAWGPTGDCPDNFTGAHATDNVRSLHAA